jgi:peptidoglycan/xylan/chitin deacetylase (PgdA/CDA1 family)
MEMNRRYEMPATFFIVGKTPEASPDESRRLLDDPQFRRRNHDSPLFADYLPQLDGLLADQR